MVRPSKGFLSGRTRQLKGKSKVSVAQTVRTFNVGDKVIINPKATSRGLPHLRYASRYGTVVEKRGKSYVIEIRDYKKRKEIIVGPVHLRLLA